MAKKSKQEFVFYGMVSRIGSGRAYQLVGFEDRIICVYVRPSDVFPEQRLVNKEGIPLSITVECGDRSDQHSKFIANALYQDGKFSLSEITTINTARVARKLADQIMDLVKQMVDDKMIRAAYRDMAKRNLSQSKRNRDFAQETVNRCTREIDFWSDFLEKLYGEEVEETPQVG